MKRSDAVERLSVVGRWDGPPLAPLKAGKGSGIVRAESRAENGLMVTGVVESSALDPL